MKKPPNNIATVVELMGAGDIEQLKAFAAAHPPTRRELEAAKKSMGLKLPVEIDPKRSRIGDWMC